MKKRLTSILAIILMVLMATGCENRNEQSAKTNAVTDKSQQTDAEIANDTNQESNEKIEDTIEKTTETKNILIAYFSRADENYGVGEIEKGNTEIVAEMIADQTEGELFHIETVTPYPEDYDECTDIAKTEQNENARPDISGSVENMEDYDIIFLGYPNWWGDMPMAVYTFLESYDFDGKTIIPFCTHAGSGLSRTVESIADTCSGATVLDGFSIEGTTAQKDREKTLTEVNEWLSKIDVLNSN